MKDARVTTELLYEILTHKSIYKTPASNTKIMICCNKSEKVTAYSGDFVRKRLEKELNAVRSSRTSLRDTDDTSDDKMATLGNMGIAYSFDQGPYQVRLQYIQTHTHINTHLHIVTSFSLMNCVFSTSFAFPLFNVWILHTLTPFHYF